MTAYPTQAEITAARLGGCTVQLQPAATPRDHGFGVHAQQRAAQANRLLQWWAVEVDCDPERLLASDLVRLKICQLVEELAALTAPHRGAR